MKIKSLLSVSSLFLVLAVALSSCGSALQITKKRHSNGYYVNFGNDHHKTKTVDEKTVAKVKKQLQNNEKTKNESATEDLANKIEENQAEENTFSDRLATLQKKESRASTKHAKQAISATKASKKLNRKKIKAVKKAIKESKSDDTEDIAQLLLIILAIICPPVAVYLMRGISTHFWISVILTLCFWLPGIIHALLLLFGAIS